MKVLGYHSPHALLNTMIYRVYFALRNGAKHRQLQHKPCQIQVMDAEGDSLYLGYSEDVSKNYPGELI